MTQLNIKKNWINYILGASSTILFNYFDKIVFPIDYFKLIASILTYKLILENYIEEFILEIDCMKEHLQGLHRV